MAGVLFLLLGGCVPADSPSDLELDPLMLRMQIHTEKLYYAGKAENWELTGFYLHEVDENIEDLEAAQIIEEGVDVGKRARDLIGPRVEALEEAVKNQSRSAFISGYGTLIDGCNQCHGATEHGFIHIEVPKGPTRYSQRFAPVGAPTEP